MNRYAIIGTGAIGGFCAAELIEAGFNVHCLLRSNFDAVSKNGITILNKEGKTTYQVKAYKTVTSMPVCDVILITLKATSNDILKGILPKLMHDKTLVVLLQNGIGVEEELAEYISPQQIIGGSCMLKVTQIKPGIIEHTGLNTIELAQYYIDPKKKGITDHVKLLIEDFNKTQFQTIASPHLPTVRWKKLAGNIPSNALSIILDEYTQDILNDVSGYELMCNVTQEVISTAKQCGAEIPDSFYQTRLQIFETFKKMDKSYSSTKLDFDAKKPLEIKVIYENTIRIAKENKQFMPLTQMLCKLLVFLDKRNRYTHPNREILKV